MAYSSKAQFGNLREVDFGDITNAFVTVGNPFSENIRIMTLCNTTDQDLYVSFDGTSYNIRIAAQSYRVIDFTANELTDVGFWLPLGTQAYVAYVNSAPTKGTFWIEEIYGVFQ